MPALIIGEVELAQIAEQRAVAAANPLDVYGVARAASQDMPAFRDMMLTNTVYLPVGFAVVYTHEIQPNAPPPGLCHHISISVDRPGELPSLEAVGMILEAFGMGPFKALQGVWVEDISPGERAVNAVQLVTQ
jgi:hypothetical protein